MGQQSRRYGSQNKKAVIAGAANNQLANEDVHGAILQERGILYALIS
jgi:glutamate dehydrogenase/leucine dehydrogenase